MRGKDASLGHFVDHQINEPKWEAWKVLPEAVRTGQVAFALAHDGLDMHQVRWQRGAHLMLLMPATKTLRVEPDEKFPTV